MDRLVSELLELERLRQGRTIQLEQHDLMEIVRDAVTTFADMEPGARIDEAPAKVLLPLDADKIRVVLGNLLENAGKYTLPDSAPTRVSVIDDGERVHIRIVNDGPEVPQADLPNLFEPFFRFDRSRSKRTGGYGHGLSHVSASWKHTAARSKSKNNVSRGATFVVSLVKEPHTGSYCSRHSNPPQACRFPEAT